jgi:hypothetical protein
MDGAAISALRAEISFLEGETAFDGWAVQCGGKIGLVVMTSWRVVYVDFDRRRPCAMPIAKIHRLRIETPTKVELLAWRQHLALEFASASQCAAFLNVLRQDGAWQAEVLKSSDREAA